MLACINIGHRELGSITTQGFNQQNPTCERLYLGQLTWFLQHVNCKEREREKEIDQPMDFKVYVKNINKIQNVDFFSF